MAIWVIWVSPKNSAMIRKKTKMVRIAAKRMDGTEIWFSTVNIMIPINVTMEKWIVNGRYGVAATMGRKNENSMRTARSEPMTK